jgi:hypothetical protein
VSAQETHIHVQISCIIEARKTYRDPILPTSSLDTPGFEKHVEDQLEITGMKRMSLGSDNTDKSPTGNNEAIE